MKTQTFVYGLWTLGELFLFFSFTAFSEVCLSQDDHSMSYTYNRFAEIEKQCSHFLSLATELKPDDSRGYRLKKELSFYNGDWEQEIGGAPLMPFDDSDILGNSSSLPLKLVSFVVTDISPVHQSKKTVSLSGTLSISISRNGPLAHQLQLNFNMRPGMSVLRITFEGVYMETEEEKGGEHLVCLLGNSTLPYWKWFDDIYDMTNTYWLSNFNREPRFVQDDQVFLVLRYPHMFNWTKRVIQGEMRSLNEQGSFKYFVQVYLSSQLGRYSKYQFRSKKLISVGTCDPYLFRNEFMEDGVNKFNSFEFCNILHHISRFSFNVVPNWNFIGRNKYQSKLGPFLLGKEIEAMGWSYDNLRLIMQDVHCVQETTHDSTGGDAKVSAVFRAFPAPTKQQSRAKGTGLSGLTLTAATRTGLSAMTLTAEGIWNSSSGLLCMIGCVGVVESELEGCDSQISMYFPREFSINQRSIILGSISSIKNETDSYYPLLCDVLLRPMVISYDYHGRYSPSYLSYNYSKIDPASAFRLRGQSSRFETIIRKSLLLYSAMEKGENLFSGLDRLSYDLYVDAYAVPGVTFIQMEVLSLGPLIGHYNPWLSKHSPKGTPTSVEDELTSYQLLNVSMHLLFTEEPMKVMSGSIGTERGRDCLLEVKVEYPSKTARWLINPTVKITIVSQRNEDDPLFFSPMRIQTTVIHYRNHEQDVLFRKTFEGVLRIVLLLVEIAIIVSQFFYIKKRTDIIPYISLVMLALQVLRYSLQLIGDGEILFKSKESEIYRSHPYDFQKYQLPLEALKYAAKLLVLAALLLIARLFQKVSESRSGKHSESKHVPSEKWVLLITLAIHISSFRVFFVIPGGLLGKLLLLAALLLTSRLFQKASESRNRSHNKWVVLITLTIHILAFQVLFAVPGRLLEEYFFLIPQIVGNILWQTRLRPLRKLYFIGFALVRILLLFYDYIRDPVLRLNSA